MKKPDKGPITPKGVLTFLPEAAYRKRWIEEKTLDVFSRWGYQEIIPPPFEYLDLLTAGTDEELLKKSYRITDRSTGRMMVLRPDITPQIARIASSTMAERPRPLRLSYAQSVFRYESEHGGRQRELIQLGAELIGLEEPEADAEVIALCIESLRETGLKNFQLALGQVDFYRGILSASGIAGTLADDMQKAACKKDFSHLVELLAGVDIAEERKESLLGVCNLFGGKEIFETAAGHVACDMSEKALRNIEEIYRLLSVYGMEEHILIDLGEVRGFDYHTGVIFEVFAEGMGSHLGSGGRYDNLIGKYGAPSPATGFALDLERIMSALERQKALPALPGPDFLIIDYSVDKAAAFELARKIRSAGRSVARDIIRRPEADSIEYARKNRYRSVIIMGRSDLPADTLCVRNITEGTEQVISVVRFLAGLQR